MSCWGDWTSPITKRLIADERRKPHVKKARHSRFRWTFPAIAQAPHRLVCVEEISAKTNMTCKSKCGTRLNGSAPFGGLGTQTFISGLTYDHVSTAWVIKGEMNGRGAAHIRVILAPQVKPRTVVICDNLATQKNVEAAVALRAHGG